MLFLEPIIFEFRQIKDTYYSLAFHLDLVSQIH